MKRNENEANYIKPNDAQFYQGNQAKRCIILLRKSNPMLHNVIR